MSELIQKHESQSTARWKLLTGASALVLIAAAPAMANDDSDHPLLWIELGGTADIMKGGFGDRFSAPFLEQSPTPSPLSNGAPLGFQKSSRFTFGGEGSLTLQPAHSDWEFSVAVRYGRSGSKKRNHHQTSVVNKVHNGYYDLYKFLAPGYPSYWSQLPAFKYLTGQKFAETVLNRSEHHFVLDFQAGKDVGLGLFGHGGKSVVSAGVRLARFTAHTDVTVRAKPDLRLHQYTQFSGHVQYTYLNWNNYYLHGNADRDFHAIGPSLSWNASAPIAGNVESGQLSLDFGINGAVLFGRQKADVSHSTSRHDHDGSSTSYVTEVHHQTHTIHYVTHYANMPPAQHRTRNVTVPDLGGNIGISYRIENAKLGFGYRIDHFFGAMDGGIDTRRSEDLGFQGLFATFSVGLGG